MKTNKIQNIILFFLFIVILGFILFNTLEISDELWNFQSICKMSNGFKIYTEINVIITPIFFYLGNILFKIFGAKILVFRVYSIIIYSFLFFMIYKVIKNLNVKKGLMLIYLTLIFEFSFSIITTGANYNILAIALVFIGLNLYIIKRSNNLIQGILIFLIFFTKQNIGVIYATTIIIYELYLNKFSKKFIVDQFKKFIFFLIPSALMVLQMYINGNLFDFINYAFGGLIDFGKKNITFIAYGYYVLIPIIVIGLYIFIFLKRKSILKDIINDEKFDTLTLFFIFSMGMTLIIFPIINTAHFTMIMPFYLIFIIYTFHILIFENLFGEEKYSTNIKWMSIVIIFILVLRIIFDIITADSATIMQDKNSHFYGVYVKDTTINKSNEVENYILNQNKNGIDVIICSYDAAYIMIDLNQNHGVYDLLFNGNLGYNGEESIKEDILTRENTDFLIVTNEEDIFWQESLEIRKCIMDNLNYKGTISNYSIYSSNE